jgi:GntR family transcriptional regulator/MocR family aminotransferase
MEVHVSLVGRKDLTGEIYRQLREAILDGRLPPGGRLPPTRELAHRLNVSRTTVTVAYDRLTGEGFITSRVGAGTFVSDNVAGPPGPAGQGSAAATAALGRHRGPDRVRQAAPVRLPHRDPRRHPVPGRERRPELGEGQP